MNAKIILSLACLVVFAMFQTSDAAFARCNCGGRCGSFSCPDPNNTIGCNCVSCTCTRGNIGFRRCCASRCGWLNREKCFRCKPWQSCNCGGCQH